MDLTDEQWEILEPLIPKPPRGPGASAMSRTVVGFEADVLGHPASTHVVASS